MTFDHSPTCPHCAAGCQHPHEEDDPFASGLIIGHCLPAVRGSRMRHGGTFTDRESGLRLASDNWVRVRCAACQSEAMTPSEILPPWADHEPDGSVVSLCGPCAEDLEEGRTPGHGRRRRRSHRR